MKTLMDNQLKNVKTHARLLSKGMWYDWRSTLLATLKDGLVRTAEGMIQDEEVLDQQQELLDTVLPQLIEESDRLSFQKQDLQAAADEIANCDQEELSEARQQLIVLDSDVEAKKQILADLQKQLERKEAEIKSGNEKKQLWLGEIHEAEKIREECRGWSSSEISVLKGMPCENCFMLSMLIISRQSRSSGEGTWLDYHRRFRYDNFNDLLEGD